tara:strand:- start:2 stop:466 length:465 start_codon:yes stop_codon:yes gene_type:complete
MFFDDNRNDFVEMIGRCAVEYNAYYTETQNRIPIHLVVAVASHESGWGTSRFAIEGNNYFGIKSVSDDPDEYIIAKENKEVKIQRYITPCDSVYAFMDLILKSKKYEVFQHELWHQWFDDVTDLELLVYSLPRYSKDKNWEKNVLRIIRQLEVE